MTLQVNLKQLKADGASNNYVLTWSNTSNSWVSSNVSALIVSGNSSVAGILQIVDSYANTSTTIAVSAGAVKTAYDTAVTAQNMAANAYSNAASVAATAYSNAVSTASSDATTKAGTAYSNAVTYAGTIAGTAYSNAVTQATTLAATAFSNAASRADAAYTNAVSYAAANTYVNTQLALKANLTGATFSGNVSLTGATVTTAPSGQYDIVNKLYADAIAAGINFHTAARVTTNTALAAATYNNGTAGVGATLTKSSAFAVLSIDGVTVAYLDRVLIKDQANTAQNGIYSVSNTGSASYAWVLTRATDYDTVGGATNEIAKGDFIYVIEGTYGVGTSWIETSTVATIGTDPITFAQFGSKALNALSSSSGLYFTVGTTYDGSVATALAVNTAYIATLSANNSTYLNGQAATYYAANSQLASYVLLTGTAAVSISNTLAAGNTTITGALRANTGLLSANTIQFNDGTQQSTYVDPISMAIALG